MSSILKTAACQRLSGRKRREHISERLTKNARIVRAGVLPRASEVEREPCALSATNVMKALKALNQMKALMKASLISNAISYHISTKQQLGLSVGEYNHRRKEEIENHFQTFELVLHCFLRPHLHCWLFFNIFSEPFVFRTVSDRVCRRLLHCLLIFSSTPSNHN